MLIFSNFLPLLGALLAPKIFLKRYWDAIGQRLGRSEASGVDFGPSGGGLGSLRGRFSSLRDRFSSLRGWFGEPPGLILEHFPQQTTSNNSKQQQTTTNNNKQRQTTTNDNKQQTTTNNNTQQQTGIRVRHRPLRGLTQIGDATSL